MGYEITTVASARVHQGDRGRGVERSKLVKDSAFRRRLRRPAGERVGTSVCDRPVPAFGEDLRVKSVRGPNRVLWNLTLGERPQARGRFARCPQHDAVDQDGAPGACSASPPQQRGLDSGRTPPGGRRDHARCLLVRRRSPTRASVEPPSASCASARGTRCGEMPRPGAPRPGRSSRLAIPLRSVRVDRIATTSRVAVIADVESQPSASFTCCTIAGRGRPRRMRWNSIIVRPQYTSGTSPGRLCGIR